MGAWRWCPPSLPPDPSVSVTRAGQARPWGPEQPSDQWEEIKHDFTQEAACERVLQEDGTLAGRGSEQTSRVQSWGRGLCGDEGSRGPREKGVQVAVHDGITPPAWRGAGRRLQGVKGVELGSCGVWGCDRRGFPSHLRSQEARVPGRMNNSAFPPS